MSLKDNFEIALLSLSRDKKKFFYIFITFICVILCLAILTFSHNLELLLNVTISKNLGYRTITTMPRVVDTNADIYEYDIDNDIKELLDINYVVDAFSNQYRGIVLYDSSFKNNNLDGTITLNRGTANTLPIITMGRKFKEGETGVAICPEKFYPNMNPLSINKKNIINGKDILNQTFSVSYYNYITEDGITPIKNETFSKKFKIVGLYDTTQVMLDSGTCFISKEDLIDIVDKETEVYNAGVNGLNIVVDDIKNVEYVRNKMKEMNFQFIEMDSNVDFGFVTILRLSLAIILCIVLFTIFIITSSYTKKKLNSEEKMIGVLRTCGYTKNMVKLKYAIELLILNSIIFIIGTITFLILYYICIDNISFLVGINYIIGIRLSLFTILLSFILMVGIPCITLLLNINEKCKLNIVTLIGNEE